MTDDKELRKLKDSIDELTKEIGQKLKKYREGSGVMFVVADIVIGAGPNSVNIKNNLLIGQSMESNVDSDEVDKLFSKMKLKGMGGDDGTNRKKDN